MSDPPEQPPEQSPESLTQRRQGRKGHRRTRIKICGLREVNTALAAVAAGADLIGLNLVEASPRFVSDDVARKIAQNLPPGVTAVALVNHLTHPNEVSELVSRTSIRCVQFHGQEDPTLAATVEETDLVKAFPAEAVEDGELIEVWSCYANVKAFLWDAPSSPDNPLGGGSGHTSDWGWLAERLPTSRPAILAGGLTPDNVGEAIRTVRPYAVDVSSGVESSRGVKDHGLIRAFCEAVREADASLAMD
ncbi:MAG: phosphoribosylanthranilate isomerase [Planctomycetota bacterium]